METYISKYKCRLCGEIFYAGGCGKSLALKAIANLTIKGSFFPEGSGIGVHRYEVHMCDNERYGFGDFIGFECDS